MFKLEDVGSMLGLNCPESDSTTLSGFCGELFPTVIQSSPSFHDSFLIFVHRLVVTLCMGAEGANKSSVINNRTPKSNSLK